jgi:hypothetical protein
MTTQRARGRWRRSGRAGDGDAAGARADDAPGAESSGDNSWCGVIAAEAPRHRGRMSLSRVVTVLPLVVFAALVAPSTAHAGKFPLLLIISDNPYLIALSVVLVVVWLVMRARDDG